MATCDFTNCIDILSIGSWIKDNYHSRIKELLRKYNLREPIIVIDNMDQKYMGVYDEEHPETIFLSKDILDMSEEQKLYYLTHEFIHFLDFKISGSVRPEIETDNQTLDLLNSMGVY